MTLREGEERLWKPCKDCGKMIPRYARRMQTCDDCLKGKNIGGRIVYRRKP